MGRYTPPITSLHFTTIFSGDEVPMFVELDCKMLKKIREDNELTQEQLAEKANISDRHIRNLETVATNPSAAVLCSISQALDVPMDELLIIRKNP